MQAILSFLAEIFSQPAFLMGLIAFVGLVALRSPGNKLLTGTLKPILGYLMLSAGAGVIVANLNPLGGIIEAGFNIRGVIPNNEAIVSVAQKMLGVETMSILLLGFIFNLIIARCTKYKYIFLTGHHSFFLACLFSAVLQAAEFHGWMLILIGGFLLGSWSAISPRLVSVTPGRSRKTVGSPWVISAPSATTSRHGSPAGPAIRQIPSRIPKFQKSGAFCAIPPSPPVS